jgi:L-rhamnonate dehydratase
MRIKSVRPVSIAFPRAAPPKGRRENWHKHLPRGLPMNRFEDYPPTLPGRTPGFRGREVWVEVTAEDGSFGLGRTSFGAPVAELVRGEYAELLVGRDALATELLNALMWEASRRYGTLGHACVAISGIDLALWDLKGKLLGQPVYRLLGGPSRSRIPLYATTNDVDWALKLGFRRIKLPNQVHWSQGLEGLAILEEQVAAARALVGPKVELMLNPVMAFDVEYAIRVAEVLKRYDFRWMEEPLIPENIRGLGAIKRAVPGMPIATGEDHHTRYPFLEMLRQEVVDIVQPDLQWSGGLSEVVKINTLAEAHGVKCMPHAAMNTPFGQHAVAALVNCPLGEFHISSDVGVPLDHADLVPGTAVPKDGFVEVSDAPGFGIEVKREWIGDWAPPRTAGEHFY